MIADFRFVRDEALPRGAVVVVGAGAAGMAVALALGNAGRDVLLLESGADAAPDLQDPLNEGTTGKLPWSGLLAGRARALGGTTTLWHGQCMRLHPVDVEPRPWLPGSGWPLSLSELDEHYETAERFLDVSGRGYDATRWDEHPDLPPLAWDATRLLHDFTEYTPKPSLARTYRPQLAEHRHVTVVLGATAGAVLVEDGRAVGVQARGDGGRRTRIESPEVVLAAGAVENARLLQLSDPEGIGLGLGREHTGRYLQDHPTIRTAEVHSRDFRVLQDRYIVLHAGPRRLFPKVRLAPGMQREHQLVDATAVFVHEHDDPALGAARRLVLSARRRQRPDRPVRDLATVVRGAAPVLRTAYRRRVRQLATGEPPSHVWLQLWLEQPPDPQRRVRLGEGLDALGLRRAHVDWTCGDQEIETSRRLTRWIGEDLDRLGIARLEELAPMHDDAAWRRAVTDAAHPAGTTRMSASPADGVVDRDLQVHGVSGLHVVGGSVFPTSGYANPTLTIVALSLRLAGHLLSGQDRTGPDRPARGGRPLG